MADAEADDPASGPESPTVDEVPAMGRVAGVVLTVVAGVSLLAAPVLARGQPVASALLLGLAAVVGAFGLLVALRPDDAARLLHRFDLPATSAAAACTGLLVLDIVVVLGTPVVYAVGSIEAILAGVTAEAYRPVVPSLPELAVRRLVNLSFWTLPIVAFLLVGHRLDGRGVAEHLGLRPVRDSGGGHPDPDQHGDPPAPDAGTHAHPDASADPATAWAKTLAFGLLWTLPVLVTLPSIHRLLALAGIGGVGTVPGGGGFSPLPHAILVSVTAGLGEEVFFRGFLQRRIGLWPQAVWFGVQHAAYLNTASLIGATVAGILFGYAYQRTGSLWVPITAHAMYDVVVLTVPLPWPF